MRFIFVVTLILGFSLGIFAQTSNDKKEKYVGEDGANRITLEGAKKHFDANEAVFIDTRNEEVYREGHIKGAWRIGTKDYLDKLEKLPKDRLIIAYCS